MPCTAFASAHELHVRQGYKRVDTIIGPRGRPIAASYDLTPSVGRVDGKSWPRRCKKQTMPLAFNVKNTSKQEQQLGPMVRAGIARYLLFGKPLRGRPYNNAGCCHLVRVSFHHTCLW